VSISSSSNKLNHRLIQYHSTIKPVPASDQDPYKSNVVLLSYCNKLLTTDGQTFGDETGKTITFKSAGTTAARSYPAGGKAGQIFFPGTSVNSSALSNYCQSTTTSDFVFGTQDFTIELLLTTESWYTGASYYGAIFLIQATLASEYGIQFDFYNGNIRLSANTLEGNLITFPWSPVNNTTYYLAIRRISGIVECAIHGVQVGSSQNWTINLQSVAAPTRFGGDSYNNHGELRLNAIRVTKGIGRDIFSVPAFPWPY
jgi:hypothetical protein